MTASRPAPSSFDDWWLDAIKVLDDAELEFELPERDLRRSATLDNVDISCVDYVSENARGNKKIDREWTFTHPTWTVKFSVAYYQVRSVTGSTFHWQTGEHYAEVSGKHYEAAPWFEWTDGKTYIWAMRDSGFHEDDWVLAKMGWPEGRYDDDDET